MQDRIRLLDQACAPWSDKESGAEIAQNIAETQIPEDRNNDRCCAEKYRRLKEDAQSENPAVGSTQLSDGLIIGAAGSVPIDPPWGLTSIAESH